MLEAKKIFRLLNDDSSPIKAAPGSATHGILGWVADYIEMRTQGNVGGAKKMKKQIDAEIKKNKLNPKEVYGYFGDPDNPSDRKNVTAKISEFRKK